MGRTFEGIDDTPRERIAAQSLFFVGAAPLVAEGRSLTAFRAAGVVLASAAMNRPWPLLVASLVLLVPACDGGGSSNDTGGNNSRVETILALTPDATAGESVFAQTCGTSTCHGADGDTPGTATTKKLSEVTMSLDDSSVVTVIIDGKESMPAQTLSDQQVADVLAYVNETFG